MADLLIKGMKIPKRCTGCFNSKCLLFFEHTDPNNSRHPNCPLVELPSHGRLIDADELLTTMIVCRNNDNNRVQTALTGLDDINLVRIAPTVLEASNVF